MRPASRRCEKKVSGSQAVQRSKRVDAIDAGRTERPLGARPEVEAAPAHDVGAETLPEGRSHLLSHLVTARADCGADRGRKRLRAERFRAGGDDAGEQAAPAGVEDGNGRCARVDTREGDGQAIRGHGEDRQARFVRPEPVGVLAAHSRCRPQHAVGVHLVVERERLEVGGNCSARDAAVLVDVGDVVAALAAEIERGVRPLAHPADAGRKGNRVPVRLPTDHRRSFARTSSWSRVLSAGSSTTASRSS